MGNLKHAQPLYDCWNRVINADYHHVENDGSYAIEREGDTVYLLFQKSNGKVDWKNNLDFPAKAYNDQEIPWKCHRGFLRVWKSIKPYIADTVHDMSVKKFVIVGYSHGAAIASLCHEYVWYERQDLDHGEGIVGYGFGCPRVYFGWRLKKGLRYRWRNFHPIRNEKDIVTHCPPLLFGFRHVNDIIQLHSGATNAVDAHRPEEYTKAVEELLEFSKPRECG